MAGDSYLQLYVYGCSPADVVKLCPVLDQHGLDHGEEIRLGDCYADREVWISASRDLAEDLIEAAPHASFITWTDPAEGALGALVIYTPLLGRYDAECNDEGGPQFSGVAVREAVAKGPRVLERLLGGRWIEAIEQLRDSLPADRVVKAPVCPGCNELGECDLACPAADPRCEARECEDHGPCLALARDEDIAHAVNETVGTLTSV